MTKTQIAWITAALIALVVLIFTGIAFKRGALSWSDGRIFFSLATLKNPAPSLDRPVNFPADFSPDAQRLFVDTMAKTKATLEEEPRNVSAWLDLAIQYRMVGDHEGALEIWEYISALYPQEGISLHNIAEYYFHTTKDYAAAESYYLRSISVAPSLSQNYFDLADMYQYVYKQGTSAAVDILKKGIRNVEQPSNVDLVVRLAQYYAATGDSKSARTYYDEALRAARVLNNRSLVAQINQAIANLK